jgi:divalent metal cation (Fe/Co/Zn/Cd) transporter
MSLSLSSDAAADPIERHPLWYQKFEAVGALGIAGFLSIGSRILKGAVDQILHPPSRYQDQQDQVVLLLVLAVNILCNL